jgi:hypothetical protein
LRAQDGEAIGEYRMFNDNECLWHGCDAIRLWRK